MGNLTNLIVFFLFAFLTIFMGFLVVTSKNIVHSALALALTFVGVAALYVLMDADFLAAAQLLIYGGAVAILVVFGVMLTMKSGDVENTNESSRNWLPGGIVATLTFLVMAAVIASTSAWRVPFEKTEAVSTVQDISWLMLTKYVVPFEVAAVLLLVAMVGAIILAKGVNDSK